MKINKVYLISHTHTDFGYTDHVDSVNMHQRAILRRAIELCESTYDEEDGTQHKWTAELALPVLDFLRHSSAETVDRFVTLNHADRIAVGAMSYNFTPLISRHLAEKMLEPMDILRRDYGLKIQCAMQNDINGLGQMWIPLLRERDIPFLSFHQNPHRGYLGDAAPSVWYWQSTRGDTLLVHQGIHYFHGAHMCIGRPGMQNKPLLNDMIRRFENAPGWPYDFAVINITNQANADNAWPEPLLTQAVQQWNASEQVPIQVITLDGLHRLIQDSKTDLPTYKGEWMDAWGDGMASSPLSTACARSAERLLPVIQKLDQHNQHGDSIQSLSNHIAQYDEHTFASYCSISQPQSVFNILQESNKNNLAFKGFSAALRLSAELARQIVTDDTQSPVEGSELYGNRANPEQTPDQDCFVVGNPTSYPLDVFWPVPIDRGTGLRQGMLQAFDNEYFMPNIQLDSPERVADFCRPDGKHVIQCHLAAGESKLVMPQRPDLSDCMASHRVIENQFYRLMLCGDTGKVLMWFDKELGINLAAESGHCLQPYYEIVKPEYTRHDLYVPPYWEGSDRTDTPSEKDMLVALGADVTLSASSVSAMGARIDVQYQYENGAWIKVSYQLPPARKQLLITATHFCNHDEQPSAIHWAMNFHRQADSIKLDSGDGFIDALEDHLPVSCVRWQTQHQGVQFDFGEHGITIAAPDTPLFQPGGPWATHPYIKPKACHGGTFWVFNNHWDTNFAKCASHVFPARFVLTSGADLSTDSAMRFCQQANLPPLIVRAPYAKSVSADVFKSASGP